MKLTSILLAGVVAAIATEGAAFDLMHPFWGPSKNQFASDTNYEFTRTNYKAKQTSAEVAPNAYSQSLAEKLLYGITDNWTVFGSIARSWNKANYFDNNNKNDTWSLGTSYNIINDGKNFLQAAFEYAQAKHHDNTLYEGKGGEMTKRYTVTGTYGYNFDAVTPYIQAKYSSALNKGPDNDANYDVTIAAYKKLADKLGGTLGVNYAHSTSNDYSSGNYSLVADTSYMFTKDVALKVFGKYLLDEQERANNTKTQGRYTVGAGLKVAF